MSDTTHAVFSPSQIKQFLLCPQSFHLQQVPDCPAERSNAAAQEGTELHAFMADILGQLKAASNFVEDKLDYLQYLADQHPSPLVHEATRQLVEVFNDNPLQDYCNLHIEERVQASKTIDCWGTADLFYLGEAGLQLVDFKFGFTPVYPENNPQLIMYAAGALNYYETLKPETPVLMKIIQPRQPELPPSVMSAEKILETRSDYVRQLLQAQLNPSIPATPSNEACQWCRAKPICAAYRELAYENAATVFQAYEQLQANTTKIDEAEAFEWLQKADELENFISYIRSYCRQLLKNGPKHGYKLVRSRGIRGWQLGCTGRLCALVEDNYPEANIKVFETKLKTAPALLKEYPWLKKDKDIMSLVVTQPGKTISIVPESDAREAYIENPWDEVMEDSE